MNKYVFLRFDGAFVPFKTHDTTTVVLDESSVSVQSEMDNFVIASFGFDTAAEAAAAHPKIIDLLTQDLKAAYASPGGIEIIILDDYKDRI